MDYKEKKIYDPVPAYRKNAFSVKIIGEIVHVNVLAEEQIRGGCL